jgi:hypothetical protein
MVQQYVANLEILLQQQGGKLVDKVTKGSYHGKSVKFIEQFGPIIPSRNLPRQSDTPLSNPVDDARWIQPADYDAGVLIDSQDKLRLLIDPKSGYLMNMVEGMRRAQDDEILNAFFANSLTGPDGTTTCTWASGDGLGSPGGTTVALNVGGTNSGMNVAKLRAAKKAMIKNGVNLDSDQLWVLLDSRRHDELLNEVQVVNLDYNTKPVLVDGRVTAFMGFNFVIVEWSSASDYPLIASTGTMVNGTTDYIPCWAQSGMHFGDWNTLETDIGPRRDKRNAQQIYVTQTIGASRVQEKKVVQIACYNG